MTQAELDIAARHGERMAWLVSDANPDVASREGYRLHIAREAAGTPPEPAPRPAPKHEFAELRNATKLGSQNCWFAERDAGCGCSGLHCHLLGRRINIYDCVACLRKW